jgi:hypothetical protein
MSNKNGKKRVSELAKQLKVDSAEVVQIIKDLGSGKPHASALVSKDDEEIIRKALKSKNYTNGNGKKKKHGRPEWTPSPRQLKEIENMSALYMTQEEIALVMGISRATFNRAVKRNPDLLRHYRSGKAKQKLRLVQKASEMALDQNNTVMLKFLLQTQHHFKIEQEERNEDVQELARNVREAIKEMEL